MINGIINSKKLKGKMIKKQEKRNFQQQRMIEDIKD